MKVAFSSDGNQIDSQLSQSFGRSDYFLIIDIESNSVYSELNPYKNVFEGAGIQSAQYLIGKDCGAIVTSQIGNNALRFLISANIKVYKGIPGKVVENLNMLIDNKLESIVITGYNLLSNERRRRRCRAGFKRKVENKNKNNITNY